MRKRIYLDNNSTTAVDSRVVEALISALSLEGNPSSLHSFGQQARGQLTKARQSIASYLEVKPAEILFTSGGTEALNTVIRGVASKLGPGHLISSVAEHAAVYATLKQLEREGFEITFLPTGLAGSVSVEAVRAAIRPDTRLITLMAVNNETGVKTDTASVAALAESTGIPFIVDGVALLGKELFTIPQGVSAMCFSGHKLHAPKGIGFAFVRNGLKLNPFIHGGEQEFGRRGGTENLPGIVALAESIRLLKEELPAASTRMENLRNHLETELLAGFPTAVINGTGPRVVNTLNVAFPGIDGESLLTTLDLEGVAVSHGSACSSGALEPSRVLLGMGIPLALARSSIRISLSRFTTAEEISEAVKIILRIASQLKKAHHH